MNKITALLNNFKQSHSDKKTATYFKFVLPAICLFVAVALTIFVIVPQLIGYFKTQAEVEDTLSRIDSLDQKVALLNSIPLQSYQQELATALEALPTEKDYITTTTILQSLSVISKIQLTGVSFLDGTPDSYLIKIDLTGSLAGIKDFADRIDSSPRVLKISGLDLSPDKDTNYLAQMSVSAPFVNLPTDIGKVEQPIDNLSAQDKQLLSKLDQSFGTLTNSLNATASQSGHFTPKANPFE